MNHKNVKTGKIKMKKGARTSIIIVLSILVISGITFLEIYSVNFQYKYNWSICTLEEQGMNSTLLVEMQNYIENNFSLSINSLVITRHDCLVYEYYSDGVGLPHHIFSVTKSFVSAMIGIAVDQGLLNVEDYVLEYFPDFTFQNVDSNKSAIQIYHLLTMSAGLPESSNLGIGVLNLTMNNAPGEQFLYNNDLVNVLISILERVIGYSAYDFAIKYIFKPLDFESYGWMTQNGVIFGSHGLVISARDMAKFGMLFLDQGEFNGRRIISSAWINNSVSMHINITAFFEEYGFTGYGFLWWIWELAQFNGPCAVGALDQRIFIDYEHDMVVVAQCAHIPNYFIDLMDNYILPSIIY
jgi:CubicO group peptidase (beta-lactamase class C family)